MSVDEHTKQLLIKLSILLTITCLVFLLYEVWLKVMDMKEVENNVRAQYEKIFSEYVCLRRENGCNIGGTHLQNCDELDAFNRFTNNSSITQIRFYNWSG